MNTLVNKKKKTWIIIATIVAIVAVIILVVLSGNKADKIPNYIEQSNWDKVVNIYNDDVAGDKNLQAQYDSQIEDSIESILLSWSELEIDTGQAINALDALSEIDNKLLSTKAKEASTYITIEDKGNELYREAETLFTDGKSFEAVEKLYQIDDSYSQYGDVKEFVLECKTILLAEASYPETINDYEASIQEMQSCYDLSEDNDYKQKLKKLNAEREDFNTATGIIENTDSLYDSGDYVGAFNTIQDAIHNNPDNRFLKEELEEIENTYIASIVEPVKEKTENKEYKKALGIIQEAKEVYPCKEFDELEEIVKKQRNPAYRLLKNTLEKFKYSVSGWDEETFDVKSAGKNAAKYIEKSGEKFILGDYSNEEITILSFTGNVVASMAGLDLALDLRDLQYDLSHWGEEDYFMFYLAADTIAIVPVIGVVKYLKHSGKLKGPAKKAYKLLDTTSAAGKKAAEILDDCARPTKGAKLAEKCSRIKLGHYKKVLTTNCNLKGDVHPVTGVKFVERKLIYKKGNYGKRIKAKFPVFESKANVYLPRKLYKKADARQFKYCNKKLYKRLSKKSELKKQFSDEDLKRLENGETPEGYTWHHNEEEGLMQLVDSETHRKTGHDGGRKFWGANDKKGN